MTPEPIEITRKRLAMRSMRRGIREMDLILSDFAAGHLPAMGRETLDIYDRLLSENDHDLFRWVSGQAPAPAPYGALIDQIVAGAQGIVRPN